MIKQAVFWSALVILTGVAFAEEFQTFGPDAMPIATQTEKAPVSSGKEDTLGETFNFIVAVLKGGDKLSDQPVLQLIYYLAVLVFAGFVIKMVIKFLMSAKDSLAKVVGQNKEKQDVLGVSDLDSRMYQAQVLSELREMRRLNEDFALWRRKMDEKLEKVFDEKV